MFPVHPLPVLAEVQQAYLVTAEECKWLQDCDDLAILFSGKSPDMVAQSNEILKKHGFDEMSKFLAGKLILVVPQLFSCVWLYSTSSVFGCTYSQA